MSMYIYFSMKLYVEHRIPNLLKYIGHVIENIWGLSLDVAQWLGRQTVIRRLWVRFPTQEDRQLFSEGHVAVFCKSSFWAHVY